MIAGHDRLATPKPFPDRRDYLFGREPDLEVLSARVRFKGLTAVAARPQMGKSWLLTELARRLSEDHEPRHLVGFAESAGETPDLLLRTVIDLYARWLSDAGYGQQAEMVWEQQKPNLLPGVAKTVARIFKEIAGKAAKPVAVAVEDAINGLIAADQTLKTGGVQLPTLSYEQARDLVGAVATISDRPIALFLDQWEKSPDVARESKTLDAFIRHLEDWPHCHVFLALRPEEPAYGTVRKLVASLVGPVELYPLEPMQLADPAERARLVRYLQRDVGAAARADDETLLDLVDGYPGVLYQWTNDYQRTHMRSRADLKRVAADAQAYRFWELDERLPKLTGDDRRLAIRLALVPLGGGPIWSAIKAEVLDGLDAGLIDDLRLANVLESADPPGFGHPKRWEVARACLLRRLPNSVRDEAAALIPRLAARVREPSPAIVANVAVLSGLLPIARYLKLDHLPVALCQSAASMFRAFDEDDHALLLGAKQAETPQFRPVTPLLSMGLVNSLIHAHAIQDLTRRDALLATLRALAAAHPGDFAVRENLAIGLLIALNHAKVEQDIARRDALLAELRALAAARPEDPAVREQFAGGLFNTLNHAKDEQDLARRDALLSELQALAAAHPEDAAVRTQSAMGLFNTLIHANDEQDLARRDVLLGELRTVATAHPEDVTVRERLVRGLFNTLNEANAKRNLARRDTLLGELRALASLHPSDVTVRAWLARGLLNTLNHANDEQDLARRDILLADLQALFKTHPDDPTVREQLAKALVNVLNRPRDEQDSEWQDELLAELRALFTTHPEDDAVCGALAIALFNTLYHAQGEHPMARRHVLLAELRALAAALPEDATVREQLAMGLCNTLAWVKEEQDLACRDALAELRTLAAEYPGDTAVREWLAKGLYNALVDAKDEQDVARRDGLLDELRALGEAHPEDAAVREPLAKGLFNTLNHAKAEQDLARRDGLLAELRALAKAHPEDAAVREQLARGLAKTMLDAEGEEKPELEAALRAELLALAEAHP